SPLTLPLTPFHPAPYVPSAKMPSDSTPHAPHTPWTEMAPQGSSTWATWSKNHTPKQTRKPAMRPMTDAAHGATKAHGAVIATRPANMPLQDIDMSGFPYLALV